MSLSACLGLAITAHTVLGAPVASSTVRWTGEGADQDQAPQPQPQPVVISTAAQVQQTNAPTPSATTSIPRVNLDLRDADIRGVLRLLAATGDFDFAMSDEINATVNVQLLDVPWDTALQSILRLEGLQAHPGVGGILVISVADKP